jgi:transposase
LAAVFEDSESREKPYSLVETAKANKLRLYEYFNYLLTEIPEHMDDKNNDFCEKLLPWSDELPAECRT